MASLDDPARPGRAPWLAASFMALGYALLGAFSVAFWFDSAFLSGQTFPDGRLLPIAVGTVTGAIGGWSTLRAPRATLFALVVGWLSPALFVLMCAGLLAAPLLPVRPTPETPELDVDGSVTSARACPICGEHRLRAVFPPRIDVQGVSPWLDLYAMGDPDTLLPPAIACDACDAQWPDLAGFEAAG